MKRRVLFGFIGAIALAGTALAGTKEAAPVQIDTVQRWAVGALGAARNSADLKQVIGCDTRTDSTGAVSSCYAQDVTGKIWVSCYTYDPNLREAVRSLKGDSYLQFHWDASGQCTSIEVDDSSTYEPKR